ncbi:MAG: hypothetical protein L0Y56_01975 [Nitrospira sp.]|nr:hypothetical protein [Nitrospira sp.]
MDRVEPEKDYEIYKQLLDLWAKENPIKTTKLQMALLVNALLLAVVAINDGFVAKNWPLYLGGTLACFVWVLSIGRTSLFQEIWQAKLMNLAARHSEDSRFQVHHHQEELEKISIFLRAMGGISSKYYLLGTPLLLGVLWLCLLLYFSVF